MRAENSCVRAALVIIGNEILSGRTQDTNLSYITGRLGAHGIQMSECRIVPDVAAEIIAALNHLRQKYDYVFTTGGIGPTHDDITAESVAKAFGQKLIENPEARTLMARHYETLGVAFTPARARMARTPEKAKLVNNPVSVAPGFVVENVYVMAGVPKIMQAMLENILPTLTGGAKILSRTLLCNLPEGEIAAGLGEIQKIFPDLDIGSYPSFAAGSSRLSLVIRGTNSDRLEQAKTRIIRLIEEQKGVWQQDNF